MDRRRTAVLDRTVALLLAAALLAVAAAAAGGWLRTTGRDPGPLPRWPDLSGLQQLTDRSWWPWAGLGAGLLLVLLGLLLVAAHAPGRGPGTLRLPGSGPGGRLEVETGPLADGLAGMLAEVPGVRRSSCRLVRTRTGPVARLQVTVDPHVDLTELAAAADRAGQALRALTGREDLQSVLHARVARGRGDGDRVRRDRVRGDRLRSRRPRP